MNVKCYNRSVLLLLVVARLPYSRGLRRDIIGHWLDENRQRILETVITRIIKQGTRGGRNLTVHCSGKEPTKKNISSCDCPFLGMPAFNPGDKIQLTQRHLNPGLRHVQWWSLRPLAGLPGLCSLPEWTQADANIKLRLRGRLEEMSGVKDWQEVEFGAKWWQKRHSDPVGNAEMANSNKEQEM